jgi:hypothetical protein
MRIGGPLHDPRFDPRRRPGSNHATAYLDGLCANALPQQRLVLVGCGAAKRPVRSKARDLYTGSLFTAARRHAETTGLPWFVLSAEHGIVHPDREIDPYDTTMAQRKARWDWKPFLDGVRGRLMTEAWIHPLNRPGEGLWPHGTPVVVEVHAGAAYVDAVREAMRPHEGTFTVEAPCQGLMLGQRLHWYGERRAA